MLDFLKIEVRRSKKKEDGLEIYPNFIITKSSDLMTRGGDFYAIWIESKNLWSTDEHDAIRLIDKEIDDYVESHKESFLSNYHVLHMWDSSSGVIDRWHKYCQKQLRDDYTPLDESLIFSNTVTTKESYASKKLSYPLEAGDYSAWDRLISVLYSEEERHKIEWCIGSIVSGGSRTIQKFAVLYGAAGTGKSTVLNIIQELFDGYCSVFDAKALGSSNSPFALEAFKNNPRVAIQHDGDLSRIEDNTRINSIVSHEYMTVNEKFKATYSNRFECFLFMGTNKPVRITDAKSGLIRRLIDISPSGDKVPAKEYHSLMAEIKFELGAIAWHCKEVYESNPDYYDSYIPTSMMSASNDFYNFILDSYSVFEKEDGTTLKAAWEMYKQYCDDARVPYPMTQRVFKEELKNYFKEYLDRYSLSDGTRVRSYYNEFDTAKFETDITPTVPNNDISLPDWLKLKNINSIFDSEMSDCPAQLASSKGTPIAKWDSVTSRLSDINTKELHYVRVPENHIVIDFDIRGSNGEKSLEKNLIAASAWPKTYAEVSKSGSGVHLHYIYSGDASRLSRVYDEYIEIKVFTGNSSLRRKLTVCNDIPINTISSGLPLKEDKALVKDDVIKSERALRTLIKRNLNKEIHPGTKPSVEFIKKILDDAYSSDLHYDVSDMHHSVLTFAINSTHHSDYCVDLVSQMHWNSEEPSEWVDNPKDTTLAFYDTEVFPNLFVLVWKKTGKDEQFHKMINPSPSEISEFISSELNKVDFNGRAYDRHILWARMLGYSLSELFELSQRLIQNGREAEFYEAYNIGYTDIYDFASAGNKKSLKQLEVEMGIHHQELGLPWDRPVPEELWPKVVEYCCNDVSATEAAFYYLKSDWLARQILADLAGGSVNDTTNMLTSKFILGNEKHPQTQYIWRDLSKPVKYLPPDVYEFLKEACPEMMAQTHGPEKSLLPYFPGYEFKYGVSTYRGIKTGEGGFVLADPGIYFNLALLDIASMHPHSAIAEAVFGVKFTKRFREIVEGRVSIKHEAWEEVNHILDGKLSKYIDKVKSGEITSGDLANALKTAINSVYGLTAAKYPTAFKDPDNIDNIVAKRGALFMVDLLNAVRDRGYTVAHIKTDSIKIPNATPEIIQFVMDFGKKYGYTFEHEATYERMCLVNDAVYIAKFATKESCEKMYGYSPKDNAKHGGEWTATGKQFQVPYVFKTLFSKDPIIFEDTCETMKVQTALYLDMNEKMYDRSIENDAKIKKLNRELSKLERKWRYEENMNTYVLTHDDEKASNYVRDRKKMDELNKEIADILAEQVHDYHFVGKVGNFCPVKSGCGGGVLLRIGKDLDESGNPKYASASGAKGYRWMESEMVRNLDLEDSIDLGFYNNLVDNAIAEIEKYGDFEAFVSDEEIAVPWTAADDYEECQFNVR